MKIAIRFTAALVATVWLLGCAAQPPNLHGTVLQGVAPEIALKSADGTPFSLAALRGSTVVIFFGYTHCPDVCPTTLSHISQARLTLSEAARAKVRGVFITVDPARDTPHRTDSYARLFGPFMIGLSGSPSAIARAEQAYHIWAQRMPPRRPHGQYTMAHSSAIYLVDAHGDWREILPWDAKVSVIAADLAALTE